MILTLSGASGAGKSTVAGMLLEKLPNARMLTSYTTREPRTSDLPGEYNYISEDKFREMQDHGEFFWAVFVHGIHYGTTLKSLQEASQKSDQVFLMILVPNVLLTLWSYARKLKLSICSFYVLSPPVEALRERLSKREKDPDIVEKRIQDCLDWDEEAWHSGISYLFIKNDGSIEETVEVVIARFNNIKP